jgi:BolA protein
MSKSRREIIIERLQEAFHPDYLEVIDESDQHVGHAGHQGGQRHFAVMISAPEFANDASVTSHRKIYALFTDMMPDQIHALRIKIHRTRESGDPSQTCSK